MNDGNSSREKAEEAYDYAFTVNRSAPQWYRFRWNTLHDYSNLSERATHFSASEPACHCPAVQHSKRLVRVSLITNTGRTTSYNALQNSKIMIK
jgi:hypothetical protein